ncbi:alpha/beta hydrolase fold domain-containing protein [Pectobacterium brasiliense]|uniref:alpha/beta hydrolase fold domain-containing protein n=1 Tax=Pectobacterium brasiliense TaxID=180957 RepID=UPI0019696BA4|nr:alpha/beta hydrolase fold domain-containing protein [Pectobacterium brasiliense]MBN3162771.1 alpha/beta hydrolase fold domain-containing protein [Pectobacterium brasiliense]
MSKLTISKTELHEEDSLLINQLFQQGGEQGEPTLDSMRDYYDHLIGQTPVAQGVSSVEINRSTALRGYWLTPENAKLDKLIVYIHGGAYMLGSAKAYQGPASQLASRTNCMTFVPDYPLAPENPFPAAPKMIEDALCQLIDEGYSEIALAGDSAGGALALAALQNARIRSITRSVVTYSPWLDLAFTGSSFESSSMFDPIFEPDMLINAAKTYLQKGNPESALASPLYYNYQQLPPLLIQVGTRELLLDDSGRFAYTMAAKECLTTLEVYEGMYHVFQNNLALHAAEKALSSAANHISANWHAL